MHDKFQHGCKGKDLINVVIQYNCIAHYRIRIFQLLSSCKYIKFTIAADNKPDTPFLETVTNGLDVGIRHMRVETKLVHLPGLADLYWQPQSIKMILANRPDAIIALGTPFSLTAWVLCILGRFLRIPVLLWGHGLLSLESGIRWWVRRTFYRLASGQLLYGEHAKKLLTQKGFDPRTLYVVYNSLNYDFQKSVAEKIKNDDIQEFRNSLGVKENEGLLVFSGRLQTGKRLDLLLEALGMLAQNNKKVHLAVVGDGSEKENLVNLAERLNISEQVHFLGESYDENYLGLVFSSSDLCVIPSGAGLSVMHAMVFGTPVLIHDRFVLHGPEWEAVEEGKTGFFYKYGELNDLVMKIENAIFPASKKIVMAENCKKIIRDRYNPHNQVGLFVKAVNESILRNKRHAGM